MTRRSPSREQLFTLVIRFLSLFATDVQEAVISETPALLQTLKEIKIISSFLAQGGFCQKKAKSFRMPESKFWQCLWFTVKQFINNLRGKFSKAAENITFFCKNIPNVGPSAPTQWY